MHPFLRKTFRASLCCLTILAVPLQAADTWKPAAEIKVATIAPLLKQLRKEDPGSLKQPTILAYKTALFLASGSAATPTLGTSQKINATYSGGEESFDAATITVELLGYADDSLAGERFIIDLKLTKSGATESWEIHKIQRAAFGRGDQR
jgi:hypothetical protein